MAVTIGEKPVSRATEEGEQSSQVRSYNVQGTTDETVVMQTLKETAPLTVGGLVLDHYSIGAEETDGIWTAEAHYRQPTWLKPQVGESIYNFEIGMTTEHVNSAINCVEARDRGGTIPGGVAINEDPYTGKTEGVDIEAPIYEWSETHVYATSEITESFKSNLYAAAKAPVNSSPWRGFARGEVRFRGARGTVRDGSETSEVTFVFAASPNRSNFYVENIGPISLKEGWHYLSVAWLTHYDDAERIVGVQPAIVKVLQVYDYSNFASLLPVPST